MAGENRSSGDDIFLLHQLGREFPKSISFCKDERAIVTTGPSKTTSQFFEQRRRWAGKWTSYKSTPTVLLATYVFLINLSISALPVLVSYDYLPMQIAFNLFFAKLIFEFLFLRQIQKFFNNQFLLYEFIILALVYPIYVVLTGIAGSITGYTWKDRKTR